MSGLLIGLTAGALGVGALLGRRGHRELKVAAADLERDVDIESAKCTRMQAEIDQMRARFVTLSGQSWQAEMVTRLSSRMANKIASKAASMTLSKVLLVDPEGLPLSGPQTASGRDAGAVVGRLNRLRTQLESLAPVQQIVVEAQTGTCTTYRPLDFADAWLIAQSNAARVSDGMLDAMLSGYRGGVQPSSAVAPPVQPTASAYEGESALKPLIMAALGKTTQAICVLADGNRLGVGTDGGPSLHLTSVLASHLHMAVARLPARAAQGTPLLVEVACMGGLRMTWFAVGEGHAAVAFTANQSFDALDASRLNGRLRLNCASLFQAEKTAA